ncbi:DUF599 domain-containing protein [Pseudidiomarina terrestris]|uniref:DUF599 domain-containing protein n=1 Tax=Pseudidiomarina terrestris TaxID=2820060 RepID=A0AAW7QYJ0_9GAMM|nr:MULTISPECIES: DUF599 domain-containing protein [unclassified Pseudidiomarina]MDN7123930.1 DUF599 domain-containing protein [Pseudidiomarina sp. 1APP75-32.1]MDN7127684.1 DUF599 domain-containing protein [Pseudidiomarina sp. 1APR75-33.1]MDN7130430.1 DUF599 domain-containing protein [Pseudidiomarina sp. 1APR75-15]MDN7136353.1 DUF599 domain-containing protein [Pseudidiomarina sp. 1ASP75-5]MDN7138730.1 DUF599 domain-containing protein [Pseudidiomarina sp. 1ASP75-14]
MSLTTLDIVTLAFFVSVWVFYTQFARIRARTTYSLSHILRQLRIDWMMTLTRKEHQIADAALLGNVERVVTFFASSTVLVLAGVLTLLASADKVVIVLESLPFTAATSSDKVQFKLACLALIFVFAFFKFTWAIRQFGFVSVLLGAAPQYRSTDFSDEQRDTFARQAAKVFDQAGHEYNNGLRAYYFALAFLCWFLHPVLFVASTVVVVSVLYRREYRSRVLRALLATKGLEPGRIKQQELEREVE